MDSFLYYSRGGDHCPDIETAPCCSGPCLYVTVVPHLGSKLTALSVIFTNQPFLNKYFEEMASLKKFKPDPSKLFVLANQQNSNLPGGKRLTQAEFFRREIQRREMAMIDQVSCFILMRSVEQFTSFLSPPCFKVARVH